VNRSLDLFLSSPLLIASEVTVRVRHNLMSLGGEASRVRKVCAHPQALAQCTNWLDRNFPGIERVPVASNAEGARLAAEDPTLAAIAGDLALELYGLTAIATGIQDDPLNRTRFLVIGRYRSPPTGRDQTSLILSVPDRAGAVHSLIEPLARHGVSMKRFESRPARQGNWEYYFHIDIIGHQDDAPVAAALAEIRSQAAFFKMLGSYPYEPVPACPTPTDARPCQPHSSRPSRATTARRSTARRPMSRRSRPTAPASRSRRWRANTDWTPRASSSSRPTKTRSACPRARGRPSSGRSTSCRAIPTATGSS